MPFLDPSIALLESRSDFLLSYNKILQLQKISSFTESSLHSFSLAILEACNKRRARVRLNISSTRKDLSFGAHMPFHDRTPESLVQRADSKNPATTCRGITSAGKKCRRSLASPKSSPTASRRPSKAPEGGVIAVFQDDVAAFYCWQHKDQAERLVRDGNTTQQQYASRLVPVQERTSIDSLVARLGVTNIDSNVDFNRHTQRVPDRRYQRQPPPRVSVQAPQQSAQLHQRHEHQSEKPAGPQAYPSMKKAKKTGFWSSLCCMTASDDDDYMEIVRHKHRLPDPRHPEMKTTTPQPRFNIPTAPPPQAAVPARRPAQRPNHSAPATPTRHPLSSLPIPDRPANRHAASTDSPTRQLLSLIPPHLSPQTTSALLTELSKPISPYDEEGYIYVFWLTDRALVPSRDTAASLLAPPTPSRTRRLSDVVSEFSNSGREERSTGRGGKKTIMLKIGRASNVHRRMTEWTRQCGYNLSLVRFYPYVPSLPSTPTAPASSQLYPCPYPDLARPAPERQGSGSGSDQVRKVPHAHRVERLIHLELAEKRVKRDCAACGKEHREWFEVEASQGGVREVDEVVRRWVGWAERAGGL